MRTDVRPRASTRRVYCNRSVGSTCLHSRIFFILLIIHNRPNDVSTPPTNVIHGRVSPDLGWPGRVDPIWLDPGWSVHPYPVWSSMYDLVVWEDRSGSIQLGRFGPLRSRFRSVSLACSLCKQFQPVRAKLGRFWIRTAKFVTATESQTENPTNRIDHTKKSATG